MAACAVVPAARVVAHATAASSVSMFCGSRFCAWTPPRNRARFLPPFCRAQCREISGRCVHANPFKEEPCRSSNRARVASSWSGTSRGSIARSNETLYAYAQFLGEPTDYVLNQVIDTVLAKDKEFQAWRADIASRVCPAQATVRTERGEPDGAAPHGARDRLESRPPRRFGSRVVSARKQAVMFRSLLEQRALVAMVVALGVGVLGVHTYPVDRGNVYLQLIELRSPAVFLVLVYGYATLWFTTPFFAHVHPRVARDHRRVPVSARALAPDHCRRTCHPRNARRRRSCWARRISRRHRDARRRRRGSRFRSEGSTPA